MILFKFLTLVAFAVIYLCATALMALCLITIRKDDKDSFYAMAWLSGLLVFLTAVYFIMTRL